MSTGFGEQRSRAGMWHKVEGGCELQPVCGGWGIPASKWLLPVLHNSSLTALNRKGVPQTGL